MSWWSVVRVVFVTVGMLLCGVHPVLALSLLALMLLWMWLEHHSKWEKFTGIFKPSNLVRKKFRKYQEKRKGTYYEGPKAPPRLAEEIRLFAVLNPTATHEEWTKFATNITVNSYQDGFIRGYEWLERNWDGKPDEEGERVAEAARHDWSLAESNPRYDLLLKTGYVPNDPLKGMTFEQRREFMDTLALISNSPIPVKINLDAYRAEIEEET